VIRAFSIVVFIFFCHIGSHAQVTDTAKVMKMKIRKSNCLFSYIKRGYVPQQYLADINPDPSTCISDTGRIVSYSLTIQKDPRFQDYTITGGYVQVWPDLVKLPKGGIIYIENIIFMDKTGLAKPQPTIKLIVE
jgi:hypothetical protein